MRGALNGLKGVIWGPVVYLKELNLTAPLNSDNVYLSSLSGVILWH